MNCYIFYASVHWLIVGSLLVPRLKLVCDFLKMLYFGNLTHCGNIFVEIFRFANLKFKHSHTKRTFPSCSAIAHL